jgi:chromosome segregation ATPase
MIGLVMALVGGLASAREKMAESDRKRLDADAEAKRRRDEADADAERRRKAADAEQAIALQRRLDDANRDSLTAQVAKVTGQLSEALDDNKRIRESLHALRNEAQEERVRHAAEMADRDDEIKELRAEVKQLRAELRAAQAEAKAAAAQVSEGVERNREAVERLAVEVKQADDRAARVGESAAGGNDHAG